MTTATEQPYRIVRDTWWTVNTVTGSSCGYHDRDAAHKRARHRRGNRVIRRDTVRTFPWGGDNDLRALMGTTEPIPAEPAVTVSTEVTTYTYEPTERAKR